MNTIQDAFYMTCNTLMFIPLIIFCFIPVLDNTKSSLPRLIVKVALAVIFMEIFMFSVFLISMTETAIVINMLLCIGIFFWLYQNEVDMQISHLCFIFVTACLIGSFGYMINNITNIFSDTSDPIKTFFDYRALLAQIFFESIIIIIMFYPTKKYLGWLVHNFHEGNLWMIACVFPSLFIVLSRNLIPYDNDRVFTGKAMEMYLVFLFIFLIIILCLYIMFYQVAYRMVEKQEILEKTSYLEMQSEQYRKLQEHVQETKRIRHDFRHQLIVLERMLKNKEYAEAETFLNAYSKDIAYTVKRYCDVLAIDAVLNHYASLCFEEHITANFYIDIENTGKLKDIDICVLLGNLLENAVFGCKDVEEINRLIELKLVQSTASIIVLQITNSYTGSILKDGDRFLSSRHSGEGQGIKSAQMIAEKYNGFEKISYDHQKFIVKILLNI